MLGSNLEPPPGDSVSRYPRSAPQPLVPLTAAVLVLHTTKIFKQVADLTNPADIFRSTVRTIPFLSTSRGHLDCTQSKWNHSSHESYNALPMGGYRQGTAKSQFLYWVEKKCVPWPCCHITIRSVPQRGMKISAPNSYWSLDDREYFIGYKCFNEWICKRPIVCRNDILDCSKDPKWSRFVWAINKDNIIHLKSVLGRQPRLSRELLPKAKDVLIVPQLKELLQPLVCKLHRLN